MQYNTRYLNQTLVLMSPSVQFELLARVLFFKSDAIFKDSF